MSSRPGGRLELAARIALAAGLLAAALAGLELAARAADQPYGGRGRLGASAPKRLDHLLGGPRAIYGAARGGASLAPSKETARAI